MRRLVHYLVRLPFPRLTCLLLAAIQLMPLPDEPEVRSSFLPAAVLAGPDPWSQSRPPLEGGILMQHDQRQLHQIAQDYIWYMFNVEEIAELCNVSRDVVSKIRAAKDSPFCLNKCRPEWVTEWMRLHPDFQLTKEYASAPKPVAVEDSAKQRSGIAALKRTKKQRAKSLAVA